MRDIIAIRWIKRLLLVICRGRRILVREVGGLRVVQLVGAGDWGVLLVQLLLGVVGVGAGGHVGLDGIIGIGDLGVDYLVACLCE